ncbi:MAG TPA: hypothetical protein VGX76_08325 [Pirellulales bacterium]|nr:hypothetical protein [Pirellulales bacterium]
MLLGAGWGVCGAAAAFMSGKAGLWRMTIWLGPLAFLLFPPDQND